MLYNSKWHEIFWAYPHLVWKLNSKKQHHFRHFFLEKWAFWSAAARFFAGLKKWFCWIWMLISFDPHGGIFWKFYHMLFRHFTTRSYGYTCQNLFFSKKLVVVLEMAVLERFWWIHSHGTLGVNQVDNLFEKWEDLRFLFSKMKKSIGCCIIVV